uniref:snRNA-activating protein complex subunit 3 n=1 Tax=Strigamia maritima TaxID=126957 RepID=T1IMF6_STRMM
MERFHNPNPRPFISTEIDFKTLLTEWTHLEAHETVNADTDLSSLMNIPPEIIKELETVCNIDNLTIKPEPTDFLNFKIPANHNLQCLKTKEKFNNNRSQHPRNPYAHIYNNKYSFADEKRKETITIDKTITGPELILTITVFQPYKKRPGCKYIRDLKMEQQFKVLGSQKLTVLRDKFICLGDNSILKDCSDHPDLKLDNKAKDVFTSGLFYINGTLYNDMRNAQSRDNSRAIIEWANEYTDMEIGPFESRLMEETRFLDLKLRLGYPYLYQHLGDCEHLMVFQDVRLMNCEDCQDVARYPIVSGVSCRHRVICMVCRHLTAKWVTTGNRRLNADPFFFCDSCFRAFNYDKNGQKIGEFFAQPFVDRSALL